MLGQILLVILLILAWIGARSLLQKRLRDDGEGQRNQGGGDGGRTEEMVRCARCGVFLPRSTAYPRDGAYYCSPEHRRLGRDDHPSASSGRDQRG